MKYINIKTLLSKQFEKGEFAKYDIIIRYWFVKKYTAKGKGKKMAYGLYAKLARASHTKNRRRAFVRLIKSIKDNGYNEDYPLGMSKDYHVCGGTHRLGICLSFGINKIPYVRKKACEDKTRKFTRQWLFDNGFSPDDVEQIEKVKMKVFKKLGIIK